MGKVKEPNWFEGFGAYVEKRRKEEKKCVNCGKVHNARSKKF